MHYYTYCIVRGQEQISPASVQQISCFAAQLSHVELLHLLFNLTTLWSIGDFEARDGSAAKGGVAYYVQMSMILLLLSGVVRSSALFKRRQSGKGERAMSALGRMHLYPMWRAPRRPSLCWVQVTLALYHVLGVLLKREQFLSVTTVGYSAVIFGWVPYPLALPTCQSFQKVCLDKSAMISGWVLLSEITN